MAGHLAPSVGEPPPPYCENANKSLSTLPITRPPHYREVVLSADRNDTVSDVPFEINTAFLTSAKAIYRAAEFVIFLLGLTSCALFKKSDGGYFNPELTEFLLFLMVACCFSVLILFWLHLIGYFDHFISKASKIKMAVIQFLIGMLLLATSISVSFIIGSEVFKENYQSPKVHALFVTQLVSGFLGTILLWIDAVMLFIGAT